MASGAFSFTYGCSQNKCCAFGFKLYNFHMPVPFTLEGRWLRSQHMVPVTLYNNLGQSIEIKPGAVANDALMKSIPPHMIPFDPAEIIAGKDMKEVIIIRPGELGDLLTTMAGVRTLRSFFPALKYTVCVNPRYQFFENLAPDISWRIGTPGFLKNNPTTLTLDMTGFYELDHSTGACHVNRLERFLAVFGIYYVV